MPILYGYTRTNRKIQQETEIFDAHRPTLLAMWPEARLYAEIQSLPHLFSGIGKRRDASRRQKIKLVKELQQADSKYFMMTDPIGDMLTRIRNAQRARHTTVDIPLSTVKLRIAEILERESYIESAAVVEAESGTRKMLRLTLKYAGKEPAIHQIKRESKPGFRMYRRADEIPQVVNGYGIAIVSTSRGLMTNGEAKKAGIGGEVICSVY